MAVYTPRTTFAARVAEVNLAVSSRERLLAYRRSHPSPLRLDRRAVRVRGLELAVFLTPPRDGTPPVVCINGGLLYGHELLWPALAPLARNRQLIFFDQRGRGESDSPPQPLSARIEHDADDVAALRVALGFSRWDALGHSWGGGIGMLAAERDRAGIRRLVLVDAVGPDSTWMNDVHGVALERLGPSERASLQRIDASRLATADPAIHSAYSRALHRAWFADPNMAAAFPLPRTASVTGSAVACRLHKDGYDWSGALRAVTANTLVMHGERDLLSPRVAHEIAALIPHARLELVPECGHMPYWEAPETFFKTVNSFLAAP